ncbi:MAG: lasso peptide biosynthesis B2 protein [Acidimicrobiales bacterium]
MTTVGPDTVRVARTLALDVATARVVERFEQLAIPSVLLKGPAMATRLYSEDPSRRAYADIDLLVPPHRFAEAGFALAGLGYGRVPVGPSHRLGAQVYEEAWMLGNPPVTVDLHRGFHGVGRPRVFWDVVHAGATPLRVGGRTVRVPGDAGCALLAALHAWPDDRARRPMLDLDRALGIFGDALWRKAADLATECDALPAFVVGLGKRPQGAELVARLGISPAVPPSIWMRSGHVPDGATAIAELLALPTWRRRMAALPRLAVPRVDFMRRWAGAHPVGHPPHPPGLASAYWFRFLQATRAFPAAVKGWQESLHSAAESGWVQERRPGGSADHRTSGYLLVAHGPRLVVWARRSLRRVHGELPVAGIDGSISISPPPLSGSLSALEGDRVLRAVLGRSGATCLEEAIIRQAWYASRGVEKEVVVGVTSPADDFKAHAWLSGDAGSPGYVELLHKPAGAPGRRAPAGDSAADGG